MSWFSKDPIRPIQWEPATCDLVVVVVDLNAGFEINDET